MRRNRETSLILVILIHSFLDKQEGTRIVKNKGCKCIKLKREKHVIGHMHSMPIQRQPPYQVTVTQLKQKWIKTQTHYGSDIFNWLKNKIKNPNPIAPIQITNINQKLA